MTTWNIDATHSTAEFVVTHMMFTKVRGRFENLSGTVEFDPANPAEAKVNASIPVSTINTGVSDRDNHLRSADFFDVEKYPTLTFNSTAVKVVGEGKAHVTGDLTLHGVTKSVVLDVEFSGSGVNPYGMTVGGFSATTKINREDFGLTWNVALEAGGLLVSKEVTISLEIQAVKA